MKLSVNQTAPATPGLFQRTTNIVLYYQQLVNIKEEKMEKFMNVKLKKIDWIEHLNNTQAENGVLKPRWYMASLRTSFYEMTDAEKKAEFERFTNENRNRSKKGAL